MLSLTSEDEFGDFVMGIDEAGRGPLAGSVFAAAVCVPLARAHELLNSDWNDVNDSKKLSPTKREHLAHIIRHTNGCVWCVAHASHEEIDALNILRATHLAMRRAAEGIAQQLQGAPLTILVDGLPVPNLPFPSKALVKGDAKSLLIAAASILAKTSRDTDCLRLDQLYPGYGFAKHKGYPTPEHLRALQRLGPCPEHRRSFRPVQNVRTLGV